MDSRKFKQVRDNLMTNAIKDSDDGVILISMEHDENDGMCAVRTEDQGIGMSTDLQSRALEEFVKGDDVHGMGST